MNARLLALPALFAVFAGCSDAASEGGGPVLHASPSAFTVSYRNRVRLPLAGEALAAEAFAKQVHERDPIADTRCAADESTAYKDVTAFLGGISWSHPVAIVKDASYPPLYQHRQPPTSPDEDRASAADSSEAAPTIERPDLVGVRDGIGIFLSKQHGLVSIDARGAAPVLSCTMKIPGTPKNFLVKGDEVVVFTNALGRNKRSAMLRYSFAGGKLAFVDAVSLDGQTILDARLFDATIVAYTSWSKPEPFVPPPSPRQPVNTGGRNASEAAPAADIAMPGDAGSLGTKMLVLQWDDALGIDWQDSLLNDPTKSDPYEGVSQIPAYEKGDVAFEHKTYASFVTASDRYFVIPRQVQRSIFDRYESMSYQVCTNYNPRAYQIEQCNIQYERRPNPDYVAPNPSTGDYSCNGKSLADCIQTAAPVVSQYVYAAVGQKCEAVWMPRCEAYETRTTTYPVFTPQPTTELIVYRFENGAFTKLDATLAKLVTKTDAIAFETGPLAVNGIVTQQNQVQFQNGHLYVFGDGTFQTLALAGNSASAVHRLDLRAIETDASASIVFSNDRAMISSRLPTYPNPSSRVAMINLTTPSAPSLMRSFEMPGVTSQLLLGSGGIFGPGQVDLTGGNVRRQLQKLTLFSRQDGRELDNLLLGTEYDAFATSWFDAQDDQRIRLGDAGTRIFLPYSGQHHADEHEPTAHRLNITRVENERLVSERSFDVGEQVVRTASLDASRSLVFGDSSAHVVTRSGTDWNLATIRELFVPFATYRLDDANRHAVVSRVGSKCRVSTHEGDAGVFTPAHIAQLDVPCSEGELPTGFRSNLLFGQTLTGVAIGPDGAALRALTREEVQAMLKEAAPQSYCYLDPQEAPGQALEFLDEVPARIWCSK